MRHPVAAALGALVLQAGLAIWLTWPLATVLATHLPNTTITCRTDPLLLGWALAHQSRALVSAPATFPDGNIFHPTPHALFYGEAGFGALPFFMGPFLLTGDPTLALNLTFLAGVALTAWSLHLVVVRWSGSFLGGALAGATFLMAPFVLWRWVPSAPNYAVLPYLPWIVLLAAAPRAGAGLFGLVVLQGLTSLYVVAATVGPLVLLALCRLVRPRTRSAGLRLLVLLALALLVLLVPYSGYFLVRGEHPGGLEQVSWRSILPMSLPRAVLEPPYPAAVPGAAFAVILLGAAAFAWRHRQERTLRQAWAHAAFWTIAGLLVSLTPVVRFQGHEITTPLALVGDWLPIYVVLRLPERLGLASLIGLALLTGVAFATVARTLGGPLLFRRGATLVLAGLVAVAMYTGYTRIAPATGGFPPSYPVRRAIDGDSPIIRALQEPGGPVLELPVGRGAIPQAEAMYRSIFHRRPILNGYSGYWPADFEHRMALACRLPNQFALDSLRWETGVKALVVRVMRFGSLDRVAGPYGCPQPGPGEDTLPFPQGMQWLAIARQGHPSYQVLAQDGDTFLLAVIPPEDPKGIVPGWNPAPWIQPEPLPAPWSR